jgi:hypothetical protein
VTGTLAASAVIAAEGVASGGTGTVIPSPAPGWVNIFGVDYGSTNSQTISGISNSIAITLANSGTGTLYYILNGYLTPYTGAFAVHVGDILAFAVSVGNSPLSGVITVTNVSDASATLATINYVVKSSGGGGGRGVLP